MHRIDLRITKELADALDAARRGKSRNAFIEDVLWRSKTVQNAAASIDVERKPRRTPGKPPQP